MAELAFGIIGNVIEKLGSVAYQEFSLAWGFKSDLKKLERIMSIIREVLLDAEKKQASDRLLRIWIGQLNDVLHDAEDVLDEIEYQALRKQVAATYGSTSTKVRHFFSSSMTRAFPFKLAHKIKGIRERLDGIAAEKDQFNLTKIHGDARIMHPRDTDSMSFVHPSTVIGRDEAKENIKNLLMNQDGSKNNVNVISIVGLGGLGKTTLAKLVYDYEPVVETFQLRMWVCVSEDFTVTRLIKEILKSACSQIENISIDPNWNDDTLQTKLRGVLRDKKFLLVLDDVWNEDHNKWIQLRGFLIDGSKGSKIIVTTRSNLVAETMETNSTYSLEGLSQEDCLSLFVKCAFKEGEEKQHPNLLKIGNEIVEKCKGVPLAVRTLGSLLYAKVDEWEWKFVRDNDIWKLEQKESDILPALKLSYDQMPIHLKRCFAVCSLFPKDHIFDSLSLILLWMANGLLCETTSSKKQEMEDVGQSYIKELLSRSFFEDFEGLFTSLPHYTFRMHDLIHDLAISVAQGECSVVDSDNNNIAGTVHHLSFSKIGQVPKCLDKLTNVRTVIPTIYTQRLPLSIVEACILRFKYLRLLDLSYSSFKVLPSSIGSLKHLRYLDLSENERIKLLPNSICKLYNLQTLILAGCSELEQLPKDIRNMISLRFLIVTIKYTCLLENGSLNSLRSLFVTSCPRLEVLFQGMDRCLTNLRTLVIENCESLTSLSLSIKHLTALETLIIQECPKLSLMGGEKDTQDLKLSLCHLAIENLPKLDVLPQWLQRSANTLQFLNISDCENFTALPEWLPTLKSLHTLKIIDCPKLSSLPEGTQLFTALRELEITGCPELSRKCKMEYQPKIAHVPKVELDEDTASTSMMRTALMRRASTSMMRTALMRTASTPLLRTASTASTSLMRTASSST